MEHNQHSPASRPASGGLIRLQARLTNPTVWLGPMWAVLCGVVASGGFGWQGGDFLRLALLILLADGGWGTLWAAIGATDWATPLRRWRNWRFGEPVSAPPYTLPNSPGDRASRWLGHLRAWRRDVLWPTCGPAISAIAVALPVTAVLGALLGPDLLLLSLAALAVMQLSLAWEGCSAVVALMLPWLAGHVAFGSPTLASAGLALVFTLAWGANQQATSSWVCALGIAAQFLAMAFLLALRQPLAAGTLALLLTPQLALLPWLRRGQPAPWYTRYARPWLMTAMLVAAWAL
ncbi:MAG: hypothetical protein U9R15_15080 [Chloroflexota bacterium]|nr:hypothetical protein [Chloroflexota bacterium]